MNTTTVDTDSSKTLERHPQLGDLLVTAGKIKQADLDRAFVVNENNATGLGPLLVRLGLISDRDLAETFAKAYDLPLLEDDDFPEVPINDCPLSTKFLKEAHVVPVAEDDEQAVHVQLHRLDADHIDIAVGTQKAGNQNNFVRMGKSNAVYVVNENVLSVLGVRGEGDDQKLDINTWIDKRITHLEPNDVRIVPAAGA